MNALELAKTALIIFALLAIPTVVGTYFFSAFGLLVGWSVGGCAMTWWVLSRD